MVRCSKCINMFFVLAIVLSSLSCKKAEAPSDAPVIITKIIGTVTNKVTSALLQGVQITTSPVTSTITTDANGKYEFDKVTAGSYVITAVKAGYKDSQINVTITEGNTATADIQLEEKTSELEITPSFVDFSTSETKIDFFGLNTLASSSMSKSPETMQKLSFLSSATSPNVTGVKLRLRYFLKTSRFIFSIFLFLHSATDDGGIETGFIPAPIRQLTTFRFKFFTSL